MENTFVSTTLSEKQKQVIDDCKKKFTGLTYKEAEDVLFELMATIKDVSLIPRESL